MATGNSGDDVEWVVLAASPDSEFAAIQIIKGELRFDEHLTCVETGRRYQYVSCGLGSPEAWEQGRRIVQLAVADGLPADDALQKGMHLVRTRLEHPVGLARREEIKRKGAKTQRRKKAGRWPRIGRRRDG